MKRLYSFAVLFHPSEQELREGRDTLLVVPPTSYELYASEQAVQAAALRHEAITDEHIANADRLEVAVRPF